MITPELLCEGLEGTSVRSIKPALMEAVEVALFDRKHGDLEKWMDAVNGFPELVPTTSFLNRTSVTVGHVDDCDDKNRERLKECLMVLHPWRKGPFELFGIHIDSEWRSDMKWDRLERYFGSFENKTILDIGCGNGYYLLRMLGSGAKCVVGVDPTLLFVTQFSAIKKLLGPVNGFVLPLKSEELPFESIVDNRAQFDTVFSMGILYHRRDPVEHIREALTCLKPGGSFVMETLIIDGEEETQLVPEGRYAKMRNVWSIPTVPMLLGQIRAAGFAECTVIDVSETTPKEQRTTQWMTFESLANFLHPEDENRTIEGHPAPKRVMIHCLK